MIDTIKVVDLPGNETAVTAEGLVIFSSPAPEDAVFFARGIAWAIDNHSSLVSSRAYSDEKTRVVIFGEGG